MIITEFLEQRNDGVNLFKTYSNQNVKIQKVGTTEIYDIAIDVENVSWNYMETEQPIDTNIFKDEQNLVSTAEQQKLTPNEIAAMLEEVF